MKKKTYPFDMNVPGIVSGFSRINIVEHAIYSDRKLTRLPKEDLASHGKDKSGRVDNDVFSFFSDCSTYSFYNNKKNKIDKQSNNKNSQV